MARIHRKVAKAGVYIRRISRFRFQDFVPALLDNAAITDTVKVDSASWTTYSSVSGTTKALTAGTHVLKIAITGSYVNIDKITFTEGTTKIATSPARGITAGYYRIFDMQGVYLGNVPLSGNRSEDVSRVRNTVRRNGLFILKDTGGHSSSIQTIDFFSLKKGSVITDGAFCDTALTNHQWKIRIICSNLAFSL